MRRYGIAATTPEREVAQTAQIGRNAGADCEANLLQA
jgi:hypothetical protein